MSTFRKISFRISIIALAFICLGMHSSFSLSGKYVCCNHDGKHGTHHENKAADEWSSPLYDYTNNCQIFNISRIKLYDKPSFSESKLTTSVAQVRQASFIQADYQHTTCSPDFRSVYIIIETLRL